MDDHQIAALERLGRLRKADLISEEEFLAEKHSLLNVGTFAGAPVVKPRRSKDQQWWKVALVGWAVLVVAWGAWRFVHERSDNVAATDASVVSPGSTRATDTPAETSQTVAQPVPAELPMGGYEGQTVRVLSIRGQNTARAVANVEWTTEEAAKDCERGGDTSPSCPAETIRQADIHAFTANCKTGDFNVAKREFKFAGRNRSDDVSTEYRVIERATGEPVGDCTVCGYIEAMATFEALCPDHVK